MEKVSRFFQLNTTQWLPWLKRLFIIVVLSDAYDDPNRMAAIPVILLCFTGLFSYRLLIDRWLYWALYLVFLPFVKEGYELAANHHYLQYYMVMCFCIQSLLKKEEAYISHLFKLLFSSVMLIAVVQKLIVPEVINGTAYHLMWGTGTMFETISPFFMEDYVSMVLDNQEALRRAANSPSKTPIQLSAGSDLLPGLFFLYAWVIILFELILAILIWTPYKKTTLFAVLCFVLFVPLATWENTFLSLLSILFIPQIGFKKDQFLPVFAALVLIYMSLNL